VVLRAPVIHKENELRAVLSKIQGFYIQRMRVILQVRASHVMSHNKSHDYLKSQSESYQSSCVNKS
jgi:hypothetical protein